MDTVLIVDDERVIRDGCTRLLSKKGYRVLTAQDGRQALDLLSSEPVHAMLCDLKMPTMGGVEVLEEVSVRFPHVPFIVITGHGTIDTAVECMKKGAYDFITKPFGRDHLELVVGRALERHKLEQQTKELQEAQARNLYDLASEQSRLRSMVNCMADGVLVTNRDLEVVLVNPALRTLMELPALPQQPAALVEHFDDQRLTEGLRSLLQGGPGECERISRELEQGGRHLRAISAPFYGPDQEVLGSVTVLQDVTLFRELNEMKSNFVHMVSHELRSPLAAIKQQLAVILQGLAGEVTEKQKELLGRAEAKIQSLIELISDLLDVAKIESGCVVLEQASMQLSEVLEATAALMRAKAESQGVHLKLELPEPIPLIQADRRSMDEVFTNLISNAVNYSPDGGEVKVCVVPREGYLEVLVSDTGVGIEPEEVPKIFDKFYRVKHPKTRQVMGTGLGLAIVKAILESHRGSVRVESQPGVGTTFHVLLPTIE
jgi:two-component system, OmpR family, phosphate regulon sensor histidine kinase PhoR